jgi:hypothetical protein
MTSTNLSRRAIVAGAASVPALAVPAVAAAIDPDPIFAAIEAHRHWAKRLDDLWPEWGEVSPEAESAREAAMEATRRLCETSPTTMAGLVALLDFAVSEQKRMNDTLADDNEGTMAFIASVARCVRRLAVHS